jgi:hypothetical protein
MHRRHRTWSEFAVAWGTCVFLALSTAAGCSDQPTAPDTSAPPLPETVDLSWAVTATTGSDFFGAEFTEVDTGGLGLDKGFVTGSPEGLHFGSAGDWNRAMVRTQRTFDTTIQDLDIEFEFVVDACTDVGPAVGVSDGSWSAYLMQSKGAMQFPVLAPGEPWNAQTVRAPACTPGSTMAFRLHLREGGTARLQSMDGTHSYGDFPLPANGKLFAFVQNHTNKAVTIRRFTVRAPAAVADPPRIESAQSTAAGSVITWVAGNVHGAPIKSLRWLLATDKGEELLQPESFAAAPTIVVPLKGAGTQWVRLIAITDAGPSAPSERVAVLPWASAAQPPAIVGVAVAGSGRAGEALHAGASVVDANGDTLPPIGWRWQSAGSVGGPWLDVPAATAEAALPSTSDVGDWWRAVASAQGADEVASEPVEIQAAAKPALYHVLVSGQSLSNGGGGAPALSTTQPYDNLGWKDGALGPLVEVGVESPASGLGNGLTLLHAPMPFQVAVTRHGVDATGYDGLAKGTTPYALGQTQSMAVAALAAQQQRIYRPLGVVIIHGEGDAISGKTSLYAAALREWQEDYEADMAAFIGHPIRLPMFVCQLSQSTETGLPLAQLAAARASDGRIVLVGPKYMLDYSWNFHLDGPSYRLLGEYHAKVLRQVAVLGLPWRPLEPVSVVRTGADIDVRFHVPVPPLVLDTQQVLAAENMGFAFEDDAKSAMVQAVEITGPDTVRVRLDRPPTGGKPVLKYALNGKVGADAGAHKADSARGNLRDSDATVLGSGAPLQNWAVHFAEPVAVAQ